MKYVLSILIFMSSVGFSQNLDSLKSALKPSKDTAEVGTLIRISEALINSKLQESYLYARRALQLSEKIDFEKGQILSLNLVGNFHQRQGRYDTAMVYYENSLELSKRLNDVKGLAVIYNNIGIVYNNQGDYDKALENYLIALDQEKILDNQNGIAEAYNNIGVVHYYMGNVDKTLEYLEKSVAIQKKVGNLSVLKKGYINLGAIYDAVKKDKVKALEYYHKALDISIELNDKKEIGIIYLNIGGVYFSYKDYNKALDYYNKSYELRKLNGDKEGMTYVLLRYSEVYEEQGNLEKGLSYGKQALDFASAINSKLLKREAYKRLTTISEKKGDYKRALKYMEQLTFIKDSLLNEEKAKTVTEMQTKYETAEKERQILIGQRVQDSLTIANNDIETKRIRDKARADHRADQDALKLSNRNNWIFGLTGGILALAFLALFIIQKNKRRAQAEKDAALLEERDKGLKAVINAQEDERKRISKDLHDGIGQQLSGLKMAWQNLSTDIGNKAPDEFAKLMDVTKILDDTANEVRSISHQMMPRALSEMGLVPAIEDMLAKALNSSNIQYDFEHFNVEQRFNENIEIGLYRISQELVNNIIKHSKAKSVSVQLFKNKNHLILMIEDDGVGFKTKSESGHGLMNIKSRLNTINGEVNYDTNPENGIIATVKVPVN